MRMLHAAAIFSASPTMKGTKPSATALPAPVKAPSHGTPKRNTTRSATMSVRRSPACSWSVPVRQAGRPGARPQRTQRDNRRWAEEVRDPRRAAGEERQSEGAFHHVMRLPRLRPCRCPPALRKLLNSIHHLHPGEIMQLARFVEKYKSKLLATHGMLNPRPVHLHVKCL